MADMPQIPVDNKFTKFWKQVFTKYSGFFQDVFTFLINVKRLAFTHE